MGRWSYSSRQETDGLKQVNVSFLRRYGYLKPGFRAGSINWSIRGEPNGNISIQSSIDQNEQYVRFIYTRTDRFTEEKKDFDYRIRLTTTTCYFGGKRYWFICPCFANGRYCGRRVGVLYLGGDYFACRHCYNLTYNSRNLSGFSKMAGQVISFPELEKLETEITRRHYAGKITRRYKRLLDKYEKSERQMMIVARGLNIYK